MKGIVMENNNLEPNTQGQGTETEQSEEKLTFTKSELDALLQKEGDKRVTQAMKKQEGKIKEAEKLAKMSAEEKYVYELEQREKAIEQKERELSLAENKAEAAKILADKGISAELVQFVVAEDADTMSANIKLLEKAFKASVRNEVEKRLSGNSPKKNLAPSESMTKQDLMKMNVRDLQIFKMQNPDEYNRIMGN